VTHFCFQKIKEELAKLEAKIKADDEAIVKSTLAQTLFDVRF
jgi:hypothetical protein